MKRIFLLSILSLLYFNPAFSVSYVWNGTVSSNWNVNANWTPSTGFPGAGDVATINNSAVTNICTLDANRTIATLNVSAGTINLGGFILTTSTAINFTGGVVQNGSISTFNITNISNTTFNGVISITKIVGGGNNTLTGGNAFNGNTTITNNDNNSLTLANTNGDTFSGTATFVNSSSGGIIIARSGTNTFASTVTINNSGSGGMSFGANGGTSTQATGGLSTSGFTTGPLTIANFTQSAATANGTFNPTTFSVSSSVFKGDFSVTAGSGDITINTCTFSAGNVFTSTGNLFVNNANNFSTVSGSSAFTRNGGNTNINWTGGNTFGNVTVTNNDNNSLTLANTNGDTFTGTATFVNSSPGGIIIARSGTNTFASTVTINNSGAGGMSFGANGGTSAQATGGLLTSGFTTGPLTIANFTQSASTANGTFNPTTFSVSSSAFKGNFSVATSSGDITINTCTFSAGNVFTSTGNLFVNNANNFSTVSGSSAFTRNGGNTNINWTGGNTFGNVTVTNNDNNSLTLANTNGDTFTGTATFVNSSPGGIIIARSGTNTFASTITINNSGSGGMSFGANGGTSAQATGGLSTSGFTTGPLTIANFTQSAATANGTFNPTTFSVSSSVFKGDFSVATSSGDITINTCTFSAGNVFTSTGNLFVNNANNFSTVSGSSAFTRNGGNTNINWTGGNTFGNVTVTNNDNNSLTLANTNGDTFTGTATFVNSSPGGIIIARSGTNTFASTITINNSGSGGMSFGANGGTSAQATGGLLTSGFTTGPLTIANFTQSASTANGTFNPTTFSVSSSVFKGDFSVTAGSGDITINTCTFSAGNVFTSTGNLFVNNANNFSTVSGSSAFTRNGGNTNINWTGGNTFGNVTVTNSDNNYLRMANTNPDDFNGTATFIQTNSGQLSPAYNGNNTFAGNISTTGTTTAITFGSGTGRVVIDGNSTQTFSGASAQTPIVNRLTINTSGTGNLKLAVRVNINVDLTLTSGIINTDAANILTLTDESVTVTNITTSATSYVDGPMNYISNTNTANSTLFFPVGDNGYAAPIQLTYSHSNTTSVTYTTQNFYGNANGLGFVLPASIAYVSAIRYYKMDRSAVANLSNARVRIYYAAIDGVTNPLTLKVAKSTNNSSPWIDIGGSAAGTPTGSILSNTFSSFSYFALATDPFAINPLPIELLSFTAIPNGDKVDLKWITATELDNDFFTIERSKDAVNFEFVSEIDGAGTSTQVLNYSSVDPKPFNELSYYRLKQTDFNGKFEYSKIIPVKFDNTVKFEFSIYPNPNDGLLINLRLESEINEEVIVSIYDMAGKEFYSKLFSIDTNDKNTYQINFLNKLSSGIYIITVKNNQGVFKKKMIVE